MTEDQTSEQIFEDVYPEIRDQYDSFVEKGISPMSIFGVYLGIMGQEFQAHASKEEFDNFLKRMMEIEWVERTVN